MKIVVLDKSTLGKDIDLSKVTALGETVCYESTEPCEVEARILEADVIIVNKIKLNETNLKNAENLKLICVAATGYDNIDTDYLKKRGIGLANVPGYSTDSVAGITVAMALSLTCKLKEYGDFVKSGEYTASGVANRLEPVYHEISALTWGVVGGGGIATKVARVAKALGSNVIMCRRKNEGEFPLADIDTICERADIISLHIPLSDSTKNLISKERIAKMKSSAIVINTARGAVTDEEALAEAIIEDKIGGLGVDVYSVEPFDISHPFNKIMDRDNVILTPHMAWGSKESRARCVAKIAENIDMFFKGEKSNRIV